MNIVKRISSVGLAAGAGLLLGGCLAQDPVSEPGSKPAATAAYIVSGTENYGWYRVTGGSPAKDIGCGPRESQGVWMEGGQSMYLGAPLWYWPGPGSNYFQSNTNNPNIAGVGIDVGPDKKPWIVNNHNEIYQFDGSSWIYRDRGRDIGIGGDGSVWRIEDNLIGSSDYQISRWNPTTATWDPHVTGGGVRIDVDAGGNPWVINSAGQIWRKNPTSNTFTQVPGLSGVDIGIGAGGVVFVLSTESYNGTADKKLYHLIDSNGGWKLTNGGGSRVSVDNNGDPWLVTASGDVWTGT
ncbi:MAG: hypothetical protein JF616_20970 [Fibrobacteres bacterium]|jgi:hypothetical protein|nr:hypothetical protein [Fibrobacterota bacterium]